MADPRSPRARRSGGTSRPRSTRVDAARLAAFEVLRAVAARDAYANLLLPARMRAHDLSGRDAAFVTELVSGTLRRRGTYDAVLAACLDRPPAKLHSDVLDVLRLGSHQLLGMRVSTHAAVSTSVDLTRAVVGPRPAGLVNAVLRKVSAQDLPTWVRAVSPDPAADPIGFASVAHSHPRWIVRALADALGDRSDEIDDLLAADNRPPSVTLVARPGLCAREELLAVDGAEPTTASPWGATLAGGDPAAVPAVAEARAGVQDEGSQLVALAFGRASVEGRDERWLDLCAGPGGKAALLGSLAAQRGAHLLAVERQRHRAGLVRRTASALPAGVVDVVAADGTSPAWPGGWFDRALVDAPCTGLGALRRRPESRWRRTPDDLRALLPLQRALLRSALRSVRPGGVVVYATCSPLLEETRGVVGPVLEVTPGVHLEDAGVLLPEPRDHAGALEGTVQLWPHRHGTDAMFVALLRRYA